LPPPAINIPLREVYGSSAEHEQYMNAKYNGEEEYYDLNI
jgi:hypothetical protein